MKTVAERIGWMYTTARFYYSISGYFISDIVLANKYR